MIENDVDDRSKVERAIRIERRWLQRGVDED